MLTTEQERSVLDAMAAVGLASAKPLALSVDEKIKRFKLQDDKAGKASGWLVLYGNMDVIAGAFGSWRTGESHSWCSKAKHEISAAERESLRLRYEQVKRDRDAEQQRVWAEAAAKADRLWNAGGPAKAGDHPYLQAKGIKPFGLKTLRQSLMVPARNADGAITTLQFISADGSKRFLTGGKITGSYYSIGKPGTIILICEGFATGASLYEATGYAVAVVFNAGNLKPVALALRAKFPDMTILICGDNDVGTEGNPGLTKAMEAAAAIGARYVVPDFTEEAA
ncbi:toprim domain-containing protein [Methylomonas rapida]|uniref:Toprim domain-containing protein n=1 Tax=Methylomonas rapida TaxID=2963939 RepID=A0ABY7GR19_9GAMM|nr:toprim domain-containing protein [Methylomonas rapida]WAR46952.1 toprim domain-containing protein [Methylomonas rapida]